MRNFKFILNEFLIYFKFLFQQRSSHYDYVVIRTDAIGDFVLWSSSLKIIIEENKSKKILLICNDLWGDLATDLFPSLDILKINTKNLVSIYNRQLEIEKISTMSCKVLLNPIISRSYKTSDCFSLFIKSEKKIASKGDLSNRKKLESMLTSFIYDDLVLIPEKLTNEIVSNIEFVSKVFNTKFPLVLPKIEWEKRYEKLDNLDYIVFFIGASWEGRKWPISNYLSLANTISNEFNYKIVFCGLKNDLNGFSSEQIKLLNSYINLIGETSFEEYLTVLSNAKLVVSNETSALHFANAFRVKTVGIVGGGHFERFFPWPNSIEIKQAIVSNQMDCFYCNWNCIFSYDSNSAVRCIDEIRVGKVLPVVRDFLSRPYEN